MRFIIRGHPLDRMKQRNITEADIENAIRNHHSTFSTKPNSVTYIGPGMNGADLKVWVLPPGYVDETRTITIKSAAWKGLND